MPVPVLETERLLLRSFSYEDAASLFMYASDPAVTRYTQWTAHASIEDTIRFITKHRHRPTWALVHKEYNIIIGECGFTLHSPKTAELHCALAPAWWHKGYAQEALLCVQHYAFTRCPLTSLHASIIAANKRCIALAQSVGMSLDTIFPHYWYINRTMHDVHLFTLQR